MKNQNVEIEQKGMQKGLPPESLTIVIFGASGDLTHKELIPSLYALKTKRLLHIIVADEKVDLAVQTIIKANQTGKSGDGKIFIIPTVEAYRVRTRETGELVLD